MESDNDNLYEKALNAIRTLFSDNSVSTEETRGKLERLQEEIEIMIDTLN